MAPQPSLDQMNEEMMKLLTLFFIITLFAACSNSPETSETETIIIDVGETDTGEDGDRSVDTGDAAPQRSTFDLRITVTPEDGRSDQPVVFALRNADTNEILHFEESTTTQFTLDLPDILERDKRYVIGIGGSYANCLQRGGIFDTYNTVTEDIERVYAMVEDGEPEGCEVIHQPLDLPAGTYRAPNAFPRGQGIEYIVSDSGRIYQTRMFVFCPNSPDNCYPSLVGGGSADCPGSARTPLPSTPTFEAGAYGNDSDLTVQVTVDEDRDLINVTGVSRTWYSNFEDCCNYPFDVDLVHVESDTRDCP